MILKLTEDAWDHINLILSKGYCPYHECTDCPINAFITSSNECIDAIKELIKLLNGGLNMMDRNDKYGIEIHGVDKWNAICDYMDDIELRMVALVNTAFSKLSDVFIDVRCLLGRDLKFKSEIKTRKDGSPYISFTSHPINTSDAVLKLLVRKIIVANFGGGVLYDKQSPFSKDIDLSKVPKMTYRLPLNFEYDHHNGSSNGTQLGTAYFEEGSNRWIFRAVNE